MIPMSSEEMKSIELQIMDEIHRMCQEHGLQYFIFFGTLLGAARHKGFIPWDDDMDIVMMRKDYEKLIAHFDEWKQSDQYGISWYRDGKSAYQFAKAVDKRTLVLEAFNRLENPTGVWVDIFPLDDYVPKCEKSFHKMNRWAWIRSFAITNPDVGSTSFIRLIKKIVCPLASRLDILKYCRLIDETSRDMSRFSSSQVHVGVDLVEWGYVFDKSLFEPCEYQFEDRTYIGIRDHESFLSKRYGNWREFPPENERIPHTANAYFLDGDPN